MAMTCSHFWALEPAPAFGSQINACKALVRMSVGTQQYLDDPPHLTLYLAAFEETTPLETLTTRLAAILTPATFHISGWHVFAADALTGRDTLVTGFDAKDMPKLLAIQHRTVQTFAPHRAATATRNRYVSCWKNLTETMRNNVMESGFPYVGPIWHPHITIASIEHTAWPRAWETVQYEQPIGPVQFAVLKWYRLNNEQPEEMLACPLRGPPL